MNTDKIRPVLLPMTTLQTHHVPLPPLFTVRPSTNNKQSFFARQDLGTASSRLASPRDVVPDQTMF